MTRKDYKLIADVLAQLRRDRHVIVDFPNAITARLAYAFEDENPKFSAKKFYKASGYSADD